MKIKFICLVGAIAFSLCVPFYYGIKVGMSIFNGVVLESQKDPYTFQKVGG